MNIGLFLGHPAHFHMLKNTARQLIVDGHKVFFVIKKKDILENLLQDAGYEYTMIREGRGGSVWGLIKSVLGMEWHMCQFLHKNKIDVLVGSTLSFASRVLMRVPTIVMGEDDAEVVPKYAKMVYPWASAILTPEVCDNGSWNKKSTKYPSYHELAYLHPGNFTPDKTVVEKYGITADKPYFVMRFASLNAHHDSGIKGINRDIAARLVEILRPHGQIYITSERPLEPEFEPYRIRINPLDMHHVMAFASLYIGDSQTMAAEAGVLGTPFVRFNDFVGRIGYLDELEEPLNNPEVPLTELQSPHCTEKITQRCQASLCNFRAPYLSSITHHYNLGVGIRASEPGSVERLCQTVEQMVSLSAEDRAHIYGTRRAQMLADKIDYAKFLTWFIEGYPESVGQTKQADKAFWERFK